MKKLCLYFLTVASWLLNYTLLSAQVVVTPPVIGEVSTTFTSLFDALRDGDLRMIELYLSPEEYAEYKVLFEQNADYQRFLQNFYRGATLRVGQVDSVASADDEVIGEFIIDFPGGESMVTRMRLKRNGIGRWNIRKVLHRKNDQGEPSGKGRR